MKLAAIFVKGEGSPAGKDIIDVEEVVPIRAVRGMKTV